MANFDDLLYAGKSARDKRRSFTQTQKNEILAQQGGRCAGDHCGHAPLDPRTIEFHHMKAWAEKGKTTTSNGVALCPQCHALTNHEARLKKVDPKAPARKTVPNEKTTKRGNVAPSKGRRKSIGADGLGPYGAFLDER